MAKNSLPVPVWPFLVANHEIARVDYRPVVAPAFLCDQACSPILTMLELSDNPETTHLAKVRYTPPGGEPCQVVVVYREHVLRDLSHFAYKPQRQVRYVCGGVLFVSALGTLPEAAFTTIELLCQPEYHAFCASNTPDTDAVVASWPLAVTLVENPAPVTMPSLDCSHLSFGSLASRPLPDAPGQRAFPVTRENVRQQLAPKTTFLTRLLRALGLRKTA